MKQFTAFIKQFTAVMQDYSIYDTVHMIQSTVRLFDGTWYVLVVFMWEEVKLSKENNPCLTS